MGASAGRALMHRHRRYAMVRPRQQTRKSGARLPMASPDHMTPPSPMAVFDAIHGFHRTAALKGARWKIDVMQKDFEAWARTTEDADFPEGQ